MPRSAEEEDQAEYEAQERIRAADEKLEEAIRERLRVGSGSALIALTRFATWVPGMFPFKKTVDGENPADDKLDRAPFVTEAYLYGLLGKEEARTFLALFNEVCRSLGIGNYRELQREFYERRDADEKAEKERLERIVAKYAKAKEDGHNFKKDVECPACLKKWGEEQLQKRYERTNLCYHRALPAIAKQAETDLAGRK